jgi:hypothetical protein
MGFYLWAGSLQQLEQGLHLLPAAGHVGIQQARFRTANLSRSDRHAGDNAAGRSLGRYTKDPAFRADKDKRSTLQRRIIPARQPRREMWDSTIEH